jgi:transcription-repair coupling factor (superfamily II helicase)
MALAGIYSISLLQTPPLMRLSIITHVDYFSDSLICGAVSFEVGRGGQVYFVHNNIQSIKHIATRLMGLLPDLKIIFIHGQESPRDIEKKMTLFVAGDADVLVCTSIIEAGIDVPNANCIIINNSHLFGLSQLYQIRGRVGRGHHQAYAYLLIPVGLNLSNGAFGRLKTIEKNVCLGSGYNISRSDMVLRGSGSVFGYKQSGSGGAVGYKLYLRLVQRALHESGRLETKFVVLPEDVLINVFKRRNIPEDYISIEGLRLSFYKSFTSAANADEVDNILYHLTNRFGPPPPPVNNLVHEFSLGRFAGAAGFG